MPAALRHWPPSWPSAAQMSLWAAAMMARCATLNFEELAVAQVAYVCKQPAHAVRYRAALQLRTCPAKTQPPLHLLSSCRPSLCTLQRSGSRAPSACTTCLCPSRLRCGRCAAAGVGRAGFRRRAVALAGPPCTGTSQPAAMHACSCASIAAQTPDALKPPCVHAHVCMRLEAHLPMSALPNCLPQDGELMVVDPSLKEEAAAAGRFTGARSAAAHSCVAHQGSAPLHAGTA